MHTLQIPAHDSLMRGWFSGVILFAIFGFCNQPPPQKVMNTGPSLNQKDLKPKTQYLDDVAMSLEATC